MTAVRIIGIGSPFGADRLGLLAARRLAREARLPPQVEVLERDRPGPALLEDLAGARAVLLLDAVAGGEPGRLVKLERDALLALDSPLSSHALGVPEVLRLGEALGRLPPVLLLLGMQTGPDPEAFSAEAGVSSLCRCVLETVGALRRS